MNPQISLSYPAAYVGRENGKRRLETLRAAVTHLGLKEVAYELDVGGTQVSDALHERDRKVWHHDWTDVVKSMLGAKRDDQAAAELLRSLLDIDAAGTPYTITEEVALTPEEEAAAYRRELLSFGSAGKAAVDRIKKRGRR